MSIKMVACGAFVSIAAAIALAVPARTNDAADRIAEKFASDGAGSTGKKEPEHVAGEPRSSEAELAAAARKRKAEEARKLEARKRAEAAREAAQARRHAIAKDIENQRRATEQRKADESDMLARARREAEDMHADAQEDRLTDEARRLIEQAERERAKAEELLAADADTNKRAPASTQAAARQGSKPGGPEASMPLASSSEATKERSDPVADETSARARSEEARRLAEKLNRVRQIRESRLAGQSLREEATAAPQPPVSPPLALPDPAPSATSEARHPPIPAPPAAPPVIAATSDPPPPKEQPVASVAPPIPPSPPLAAAPIEAASEPTRADRPPHVAQAPATEAGFPTADRATRRGATHSPTRVAVLLVMVPGNYGIRRGRAKVADPVLCAREGCYISTGPDRPAVFLPGRKALGIGNTWGGRAGACRHNLGCVFRDIELGSMPGFLQPVDLHIFKHDIRVGHMILADSDCRGETGRLFCRHGIEADDYTMWIVPESLAQTLGPAALQRALSEGLNGPRSAALESR